MRTRLSSPAVATCAPAGLTSIARIELPACASRLQAQLSLHQPHQSHAEALVTRARAQLASMSRCMRDFISIAVTVWTPSAFL